MGKKVHKVLISEGNLAQNSLHGDIAIVTGAGRGIGYEAARALIWLGAKVVIAEINENAGKTAAENLEKEFGSGKVVFVKTDVGNDKDIEKLAKEATTKWGKVDIVLNNATVFPIGEVKEMSAESWDFSYRVNLRGPVLLARVFLPDMIRRRHGVFVCISSSGAAPYMGAYEVFKTAQVELANTIAGEVEGSGVYAFTIGPGIVMTPGFVEGGAKVASFMGKTLEELLEMNKDFQISPEAAGTGFAAAIVLASKYHGQETSSVQVLREIGIDLDKEEQMVSEKQLHQPTTVPVAESRSINDLYQSVLKTYTEQSEGWKKRNLFERQWVLRDFKKNTGRSVDEMLTVLKSLGENLKSQAPASSIETLEKLSRYYVHQQDQLKGFEKNPEKLKENLAIIDSWINDIEALRQALAR
jgi:NAD(P)-dependent dehydrogenase (short-subunit alcohol dehydrogenase family)